MVTLGSSLIAKSKVIGYGCNAKPNAIVSDMAAKLIFFKIKIIYKKINQHFCLEYFKSSLIFFYKNRKNL
jgi:hypothetical protein